MKNEIDLLDLAGRQHGAVGREQAQALGVSAQELHRARIGHHWMEATPRVLVRRGSTASTAQRLAVAVLDAGPNAFLSHGSAAAWWGLPGFSSDLAGRVHVTRPRGRTRRPSAVARIHEVLDLLPGHLTTLDGIPVSMPARTIFEVAATVHPARAERACDNAWSQHLVSRPQLYRMLVEWADRGRAGTTAMRDILERRPLGYVPPASNLESRFATLVSDAGLGPFNRQVDVGGEHWVGRVDYRHDHLPLVVEILSRQFHLALLDQEADRARFAALAAAGFDTVSIWDTELWEQPRRVRDPIGAAEARLRRRAA